MAGRGDSSGGEEDAALAGGRGESPGADSESPPGASSRLAEEFESAAQRVAGLAAAAVTTNKEQLLYLYARYKQVRRGGGHSADAALERGASVARFLPACLHSVTFRARNSVNGAIAPTRWLSCSTCTWR